jgi:hypothetical protein
MLNLERTIPEAFWGLQLLLNISKYKSKIRVDFCEKLYRTAIYRQRIKK